MQTPPIQTRLRSQLIWCVAAALSLYFFAQSSKQLHNLFYVLVLLPTLITLNKQIVSSLAKSHVLKGLLIFSIWSLLSVAWSEQPDLGEAKDVLYVLLFVIAIALAWQQRDRIPFRTLIIFSLLTVLPSLYFLFTMDTSKRLAAYGIFSNPLTAANSLVFLILANIYLATLQKNKFFICFFLTITAIHLGTFIMCQSRGSMAALVVGSAVLMIASYPQKNQLKLFSILAILALLLSCGYATHKNWLAIIPGHTNDITYDIPSQYNIDSVVLTEQDKHTKRSEIIVSGLSSGANTTLGHTIKLDQPSHAVTVHFISAPLLPYKYIQLEGINREGHSVKVNIAPPRIINFDSSFGNRLPIWEGFFEYYLQAPIIGHGASHQLEVKTESRATPYLDPHNVYLGTALRSGSVGLILHLLLVALTVAALLKRPPHQPVFLALLSSGLVTTMLDDTSFFASPLPYWLLVLIPIGYAIAQQSQPAKAKEY